MNFIDTPLPGVVLIEPKILADERGFFLESYHLARFRENGIDAVFVQDNHSRSKRGVLRGLHYQEPNPQGKLLRCIRGSIFDVAVDIRPGSAHFARWYAVELSDENQRMLWVPQGFAHGFCALTEVADLVYKVTAHYDAKADRSILWNDPGIGIEWPISEPILSPKDAVAPLLRDALLPPS